MSQSNMHLSPQDIITQVQQGDYPAAWRVYKPKYGFATIIAILMRVTIAYYIVILGIYVMYWVFVYIEIIQFIKVTITPWVIIVTLLCFFLFLPLTAMYRIRQAASRARTLIVLLPDSMTYCYRGIARNAYTLYFSDIASMHLSNRTDISGGGNAPVRSTTVYWLDIETLDGRSIQWYEPIQQLDNPQFVVQTIIATYNYYKRQYG